MTELKKTLPAKYYTDPQVFKKEMERFYFNSWIHAGRTEEIGEVGSFIKREVGGESVVLLRNEKNTFSGFYNVCPHRGTQLCEHAEGKFTGRVQCPYHAWTFSYEGALVGAPGMNEVAGFAASEFPLRTFAVEEWGGHLFVNLSLEKAKPLAQQLDKLPEKFKSWNMQDLKLGKRIVYDVKANWKLILQNYSECLHCPVIHPALAKLSHYLSGENEPPHPAYLGGRMVLKPGVKTMTMDGNTTRKPLPGLPAEELSHVYYYSLLPNFLLSLHPDYMMTHTMWPKGNDRTEVVCEFHFHPDAMAQNNFSAEDAFEFWDLTNRQDWHVSELSQRGISSRAYLPGPYSNRESLLWGLDDIVREAGI